MVKSYTDLEQSKKLVEFLPIESADMGWNVFVDKTTRILPIDDWDLVKNGSGNVKFYHAWSLAALLDVLPDEISTGEGYQNKYEIDIRRYYGGNNITLYQIAYGNNKGSSGSWHDIISTSEQEKFVDVCYEMICWLKENNKL